MRHIVELLESHCHHSTTTTTLQPVKMTCLILPITNSSKTFTWWPRGDSSASLRSRSVKGGSRKKVYGRPFHIYSWAGSIHPSIQLTGWETPRLQPSLLFSCFCCLSCATFLQYDELWKKFFSFILNLVELPWELRLLQRRFMVPNPIKRDWTKDRAAAVDLNLA